MQTTKTCTKCNSTKPTIDFSFRNKAKEKLCSWCKSCQKGYKDQHYQDNRDKYIRKMHTHRRKHRTEMYTKMMTYYKSHPCLDCGEDDYIVCQSDHTRGKKRDCISHLIHRGCQWSEIEKELAKCETRCANCHMRKTAKEFDWYKDMASSSKGKETRLSPG